MSPEEKKAFLLEKQKLEDQINKLTFHYNPFGEDLDRVRIVKEKQERIAQIDCFLTNES